MSEILKTYNNSEKEFDHSHDKKSQSKYDLMYFFTVLYLIIDYGRPQDLLPIGFLRPAMIVILILTLFVITNLKYQIFESKQIKLIVAFTLLLSLYIPFARNNYYAFKTTKQMVLYLPFIFCAIMSINTIDRLKKTIHILIVIMIYVSGYALTHGGKGSGNYFIDENDVSLYINMWLPFCYFLLFIEKKRIIKTLCITGLILGLSAVVYSRSRGGFVGLLAVGFIIWLYSPNKFVTLTIIGFIGLLIVAFSSQSYWNEMSTITDLSERTANTRIESWKAAWNIFIDHPLGVGGNNFQVWFNKYQSEYFKRGMWGRVAHSLWFTIISELGIAGIIIYFLLLYYNLKDIFYLKNIKNSGTVELKYINYLSLAFLASLAGYFASGTFISVLYYSHYWYLTALIVATINIVVNNYLDPE